MFKRIFKFWRSINGLVFGEARMIRHANQLAEAAKNNSFEGPAISFIPCQIGDPYPVKWLKFNDRKLNDQVKFMKQLDKVTTYWSQKNNAQIMLIQFGTVNYDFAIGKGTIKITYKIN